MRGPVAAVAVLVALAAWPAASSAAEQTFCVADPDCSGTPEASVANALAAAQANGPERDRIRVGPGTFLAAGSLTDSPTNPVLIEGAGEAATILTRPAAMNASVLSLGNAQSSVSKLGVQIPAGQTGMTGIVLAGGASGERVFAISPPALADARGVFVGDGSSLRQSLIELPTTTAAANDGVVASDDAVVESSDVVATRGVLIRRSGTLVRGLRIVAGIGVEFVGSTSADATATVENTQVTSVEPPAPADVAIKATGPINATHSVTLSVRHVTLIGPGGGNGFWASGESNGFNPTAALNVLDSVVRGYTADLRGSAGPMGTASLSIDSSAFDFTKVTTNNPITATINPGPNNLNLSGLDPKLIDVRTAMRPAFDSPLVDRGMPGGLLSTESQFDLALQGRLVDGNGDGTARRDMGAFEYQRAAPEVTASAASATAGQGQAITFNATATDSDPQETTGAITWVFDDGATATGASAQHAFAAAGAHTATASATDPAGVTGTGAATVIVTDTTAPALRISRRAVRLTRRGVAAVALTCPGVEVSGPCQGRLTLRTARRFERPGSAVAKRIRLGSRRFSIPAGRRVKVRIKLSKANRRLVTALRRLRVGALAAVHDQAGNSRSAKSRFKLRARARRS
jgi:PKD domain